MTGVKWNTKDYDSFFSSQQAKRENKQIKRLLTDNFSDVDRVVDLGCGTGLAQDLIPEGIKYVGTDISADMVIHCRNNRNGEFLVCDAGDAIHWQGAKVALFSLSDFSIKTIVNFARQDMGFAVAYSRPYLKGSASAFQRNKWRFLLKYGIKTLLIKCILKASGFKMFKLLGEPYYFVAVKKIRRKT